VTRPNRWPALWLSAVVLAGSLCTGRAASQTPPIEEGCGVSAGTLTMLATDNQSDFAAFALDNAQGRQLAQQFIPLFSRSASAELMLTRSALGAGESVASVKCLADSSVSRCPDRSWQPVEKGVGVSLSGVLLGNDWIVVSLAARYVNLNRPAARSIDGSDLGFQLDSGPVTWSALYDSQTEASQSFFGLKSGAHTLTYGSRDPADGSFVPQNRLCFET
jgi:hypothetical protein